MFPLWTKTDLVPRKQTNTENNCAWSLHLSTQDGEKGNYIS